jgi:chorismate synthase
MTTLRYLTAGESHGRCLQAILEGVPYGTPVAVAPINAELARRQGGYGRGARMKIEKDEVEVVAGVRQGRALGSPLVFQIANQVSTGEAMAPITRPRPGHADLAGVMKFGTTDARDVSERASARETAARVAAGAFCSAFLESFGIRVVGYVVEIGGVKGDTRSGDPAEIRARRAQSMFYTMDEALDQRIKDAVDDARAAGDTLGGVFEVAAFGLPPGLGSHAGWQEKLDGRLARALMSVQTVKAVEVGLGFEAARRRGSQMHDEIVMQDGKIARGGNNAGGVEGGMTNGQPLVVRGACKPISTLRQPLKSVDLATKEESAAAYERSDVCVVPAASVIGEAVVAFELARVFLDKFGGDTIDEVSERFGAYQRRLEQYGK